MKPDSWTEDEGAAGVACAEELARGSAWVREFDGGAVLLITCCSERAAAAGSSLAVSVNGALYLLVARGLDAGTRLAIDGGPKTVGRSRDCHLVVSDPSVSRNHFQIVSIDGRARVVSCPGATPIVVGGRAVQGADLDVGESVIAGNTVFVLAEGDQEKAAEPSSGRGVMSAIQTLMSGVAADVRGLAAVFALNDSLRGTQDPSQLVDALASWAKTYADARSVELTPEIESPDAEHAPREITFTESPSPAGGTRIVVPAFGSSTGRVTFSLAIAPERVSDSLRRLLVVAGALFGSSFACARAVSVAEDERDSMRALAIGSSRVFLAKSAAGEQIARILPRLARSDATVLVLGETGVGKSFVARLIHEAGPRAKEPLRIINCAAIPESLVESELFGHERGAFSGAVSAREGALESAAGGTILLDEIGEMPLASQAKLLRVLEERKFERVGSNRSIPLRARVLAATNRNLGAMVDAEKFRRDLFFRISVITVKVPAVRERPEDLVPLAEQILADLAPSCGRRVDGFSREALDAIRRYPWPGNVRELRNAIEHALVLGEDRFIRPRDFPVFVHSEAPEAANDDPSVVRLPAPLDWLEERAIDAALKETGGNRTRAAALLGINRTTLHNRLVERRSTEDP